EAKSQAVGIQCSPKLSPVERAGARLSPGVIPERVESLARRAHVPAPFEPAQRVAIDAERLLVEPAQRRRPAERVALEHREHALRAELPGGAQLQREPARRPERADPFALALDRARARGARPLGSQRLALERLRGLDLHARPATRTHGIVERDALQREHGVLEPRLRHLVARLDHALLVDTELHAVRRRQRPARAAAPAGAGEGRVAQLLLERRFEPERKPGYERLGIA